jgi:hypothetical protein
MILGRRARLEADAVGVGFPARVGLRLGLLGGFPRGLAQEELHYEITRPVWYPAS